MAFDVRAWRRASAVRQLTDLLSPAPVWRVGSPAPTAPRVVSGPQRVAKLTAIRETAEIGVPSFVPNWPASQDKDANTYLIEIAMQFVKRHTWYVSAVVVSVDFAVLRRRFQKPGSTMKRSGNCEHALIVYSLRRLDFARNLLFRIDSRTASTGGGARRKPEPF
jgi:hypothetical protein